MAADARGIQGAWGQRVSLAGFACARQYRNSDDIPSWGALGRREALSSRCASIRVPVVGTHAMNERHGIHQPPPLRGRFRHEKVQGTHLDRWAVVYVRQSTLQQVRQHQESGRLQYALKERALQLGWSSQQVIVIDEDQGQTGTTAEGRLGFQRLVAEVGLDHVGIILGIEMSRLARCGRDWHHLLEICALFRTLLGDADGIYDPNDYNDRLLLGLQGTMSEAEVHLLKQRMLEGKRAKARRGELGMSVPIGYVRRPSGEAVKDLDEEAQAVVELVFESFERCRTIDGLLRYLVQQGIRMPVRVRCGPDKGMLQQTF